MAVVECPPEAWTPVVLAADSVVHARGSVYWSAGTPTDASEGVPILSGDYMFFVAGTYNFQPSNIKASRIVHEAGATGIGIVATRGA